MYKWNILGEYNPSEKISNTILKNRGIKNIKEFISPSSLNQHFKEFPAEFKKSLTKARDIIKTNVKDKKHIIIFGDYDSDGINATAILFNFLKFEKKYENVSYFIPNRFEHSYGLSIGAIDEILDNFKEGEKVLFITVDVGITAIEEVSYIKKLGHSIIITDHHQKPDKLPKADCILWSDKICGAVISWVLSKALGSTNFQSIALACVATVTDMQSALGFNRVVLKKGLEIMNKNPPLGLKKLLEILGRKDIEVTTYELGWVIGPRLNASGRLQTSEDSIKLLTEENENVLEEIVTKLNSINIERQEKTIEMFDIASDIDEKNLPKIIFSSDKKYHEGVIGLVSSKLTQKYYRPSVVISLNEGVGKGSVRSISGINIIKILRNFENLFIDLGGHPMAGGFTIEEKNIPEMKKKVTKYIEKEIKDEVFIPIMNIDLKIPPNIIDFELINEIDKIKPFGIDNEQPVFLSENLGIVNCDIIGRDKTHIKLKLYDGEKYHKAVFFGGSRYEKELSVGEKIDMVYTLSKNEYNGNKYVDLVVKDFRKV